MVRFASLSQILETEHLSHATASIRLAWSHVCRGISRLMIDLGEPMSSVCAVPSLARWSPVRREQTEQARRSRPKNISPQPLLQFRLPHSCPEILPWFVSQINPFLSRLALVSVLLEQQRETDSELKTKLTIHVDLMIGPNCVELSGPERLCLQWPPWYFSHSPHRLSIEVFVRSVGGGVV